MIHFGSKTTKKTACGKTIARRWWVWRQYTEGGRIGNLTVYRIVRGEANCPHCLAAVKR